MNTHNIWVMYYGGLVAIKAHPKNEQGPDLEQCADIADEMLKITIDRLGEPSWRDGQQRLKPGCS